MNITPKFITTLAIALLVIAGSFILLGWFFSFSRVFFAQGLFSITNPIGIIGIILILVVGGFYLFKIGFSVMKNSL